MCSIAHDNLLVCMHMSVCHVSVCVCVGGELGGGGRACVCMCACVCDRVFVCVFLGFFLSCVCACVCACVCVRVCVCEI